MVSIFCFWFLVLNMSTFYTSAMKAREIGLMNSNEGGRALHNTNAVGNQISIFISKEFLKNKKIKQLQMQLVETLSGMQYLYITAKYTSPSFPILAKRNLAQNAHCLISDSLCIVV